jgi:hypothetical protein
MAYPNDPPVPSSLTLTSNTINNDLVAWWPLTDGAGNATDISSNGYDGTATSSPTFESTSIGTAASFAGGSRFEVSSDLWNTYVDGQTQLSMAGWYYADSLVDQSIGLNCYDGVGGEFLVRFDANRVQGIIANGGFVETINSGTAATAGQWQQYAVTVDMSIGEMKVYMDGSLMTHRLFSSRTFSNLIDDPAIGASTSASRPFTGEQQNIRFWSRVITSEEVSTLFTDPWAGSSYSPNEGGGGSNGIWPYSGMPVMTGINGTTTAYNNNIIVNYPGKRGLPGNNAGIISGDPTLGATTYFSGVLADRLRGRYRY